MLRFSSVKRFAFMAIIALISFVLLILTITDRIALAQDAAPQPAVSQVISSEPVRPGILVGGIAGLPKTPEWQPGDPLLDVPQGITNITPVPLAPNAVPNATQSRVDEALQLQPGDPSAVTPPEFLNPNPSFPGISFTGARAPDPNGAIGPNHYIQMVNMQLAIWDRQGNLLAGPTAINQIWKKANIGTSCQDQNDGDPVVLYDRFADRWLISQLALPKGVDTHPFQCIAISQTGDPVNGNWYAYEFELPFFKHDYPKLSVWPDAYYMTSQEEFTIRRLHIVAFDRANMLNGNPATFQTVRLNTSPVVLLPSDADWKLPPTGSPAFFARQMDGAIWGGNDRVEIYQYQVDWSNPANSSFTGPTSLNTAAFDSAFCRNGDLREDCIPQPAPAGGGVSIHVDAASAWPMSRLQYHNFGNYEAMVFNHTVDADGNNDAGIRWYELRRSPVGSGTWTLYQQGTFAPQQPAPAVWLHRWLGSIAMDKAGNMALGYSVSDAATTFPGIRYTGRLATDPLGLLPQREVTMTAGAGPVNINPCSNQPCNRWGDYSSMTLDPVDGCTFWYTSEYGNVNQNWSTHIGAFRFPSCDSAAEPTGSADLRVSKDCKPDRPQATPAGTQAVCTITIENLGPSEASNVTLNDAVISDGSFNFGVITPTSCSTGGPNPQNGNGTVTCLLAGLSVGASVVIRVPVSAAEPQDINNRAVASSTTSDPDMANNVAVDSLTVSAVADLALTKSDSPDPVAPGVPLTYTLVVTNNGPSTAHGVVLSDTVPDVLTVINSTVSYGQGMCLPPQGESPVITCQLGTMASGVTATIAIVAVSQVEAHITNFASVTAQEVDLDLTNNAVAESTVVSYYYRYMPTILMDFSGLLPNLTPLEMTIAPTTGVSADSVVTITLTLKNVGQGSTRSEFWVDLYVNPRRPPEKPLDIWNLLCQTNPEDTCPNDLGIAWLITRTVAPGETITLRSVVDDPYLVPDQTRWSGKFGTVGIKQLWAYVDPWGEPGVAWAAIKETDEGDNILGPISLYAGGRAAASAAAAAELVPARPWPKRLGADRN